MGFINRLRNVTEKKVKAAEERYRDELKAAEADLDAELDGEDPALRRARERVRALREQQPPNAAPAPAQKRDDAPAPAPAQKPDNAPAPSPAGNRPRSL